MSFSSGTFTINSTGQPVVTGTVISSTVFNALTADLATGLSTCVLKDGTQTITASIPMAGFKLTGLGAGTATGNSLRYEQIFNASNLTLTSHLLFSADATWDIGASGATRPRTIYLSSSAIATGFVQGGYLAPSSSSLPAMGIYLPATNQIGFAVNSVERQRIVAATTDNNGETMSQWSSIVGTTHIFQSVSGTGYNAANSAFKIGKDNTTSRSINAGGTVGASGADYAEYERKNAGCADIAKGQIVGFDENGLLTDKWNEAITFGVKSTEPAYVGGDTWGREEDLGMKEPLRPDDINGDATENERAEYSAKLSDFEAQRVTFRTLLESARQKVDRIAYAGKVPVNVIGANVGDWIVPAQDGDGIAGESTNVFSPNAVGRVRRILPDGRAEIAI